MLVLDLTAPICVVSSENLWYFGKKLALLLWNECVGSWRGGWGLRLRLRSQCRFSIAVWRSKRNPGCHSVPPAPGSIAPCPARLQPGSMQAGGRCVLREGLLVPWLPQERGARCSRAFLLLLAVCHSMQETTLKASSAFLGSSISSESVS